MLWCRVIAVAFIVGLFATLTAVGQPPVRPTHLALEVYFFGDEPPAYMVVPPANSSPSGTWFARFKRVPAWTAPAGSLQVNAVNFRPTLDGGAVRVAVSVLMGIRLEEEKEIAVYTLREGEKIRVQELTQFGVEPFGVKLVRVAPSDTNLPTVISNAKSIELVNLQANLSTLPSYRLALRNVSSKNVSAIGLKVMQGNRTLIDSMPQGKEGEPLILAGGVSEVTSPLATRAIATPGGYDPIAPPNQNLEITMAVFEDGSFEGDIESAAGFRGFVKGRKIQLRRLVEVFQTILQDDSSNPSALLERLRSKVNALSIEADAADVQELAGEFSVLAERPKRGLTSAIEAAMTGIRRDAQEHIAQFQLNQPDMAAFTLHAWLLASKQRYEAWLARL
jgi:hypothetical protein